AEEFLRKNVTLEAWQLVKIVKALNENGEATTLKTVADLARRNTKHTVSRKNAGKGKTKEKYKLDLDQVAGGKVDLTKDEIEYLLVDLLLLKYLEERYQRNKYSTSTYLICGPRADILSRHTKQSLLYAHDTKIEAVFRRKMKNPRGRRNEAKASPNQMANLINPDDIDDEFWDDDGDGEIAVVAGHQPSFVHPEDTSSDEDEWSISFRKKGLPPTKKIRISASNMNIVQ
ncbi:hypothetical protein C0993_007971, partial [Termitomyces sp. T159_Od127]